MAPMRRTFQLHVRYPVTYHRQDLPRTSHILRFAGEALLNISLPLPLESPAQGNWMPVRFSTDQRTSQEVLFRRQ